jgi:hypothetical protein
MFIFQKIWNHDTNEEKKCLCYSFRRYNSYNNGKKLFGIRRYSKILYANIEKQGTISPTLHTIGKLILTLCLSATLICVFTNGLNFCTAHI